MLLKFVFFFLVPSDIAFSLAKEGRYGHKLEEEANSIENTPLPKCMSRTHRHRRFGYTVGVSAVLLLVLLILVTYFQISEDHWVTKTFRVEFQESTGLKSYTGCYNRKQTGGSLFTETRKVRVGQFNKYSSLVMECIWAHYLFYY